MMFIRIVIMLVYGIICLESNQFDQIHLSRIIDHSNKLIFSCVLKLGKLIDNNHNFISENPTGLTSAANAIRKDFLALNIEPTTAGLVRSLEDRLADMPRTLSDYAGFDPTGAKNSNAAITAWLNATATTGGTLLIRKTDKVLLTSDIVINQGQRILGEFDPRVHSASDGTDAYDQAGGIRLLGAKIRLDNGGTLQRMLIYRQGLIFNVAQDFATWTGDGLQLGYGNDQSLRDVMVLGFDRCVAPLFERGLNGSGRVVIDGLYMDCKSGLKLVGSYDTSFVDRVRAFPFATGGYAGRPAAGERYDPRKDRRPGIGVQVLDRADGTKFGRIEVFSYATGYDFNVAGWQASNLVADYGATATYPAPSGTVGFQLRADTDNSTGTPRAVDFDPSSIAMLTAFSMEKGIVVTGMAGRSASVGIAKIIGATGDAITIDGGGVTISDLETILTSGAPVRFASPPITVSRIRGRANQFGKNWDSATFGGNPVVKTPAGSLAKFIDVKLASDHPAGAIYFDNAPLADTIASANPLVIPDAQGQDMIEVRVTGTTSSGVMFGPTGVDVDLYAVSGFTLFASTNPNGFNLPTNVAIPAKGRLRLRRSGDSGGWEIVGKSF